VPKLYFMDGTFSIPDVVVALHDMIFLELGNGMLS
jgi:hypothetical protein